MHCGSCKHTDGCCYSSMPPKVRCVITNKFHYYEDVCDCEEAKFIRDALLDTSDKDAYALPLLNNITNSPSGSINITAPAEAVFPEAAELDHKNIIAWSDTIVGATPCLVCGEPVSLSYWQGGPKICNDCKKVIKFVKEKFKEELNEV